MCQLHRVLALIVTKILARVTKYRKVRSAGSWDSLQLQLINCFDTLAAERLLCNSTGIHYTSFSIIMLYSELVHFAAPRVCWSVY